MKNDQILLRVLDIDGAAEHQNRPNMDVANKYVIFENKSLV